MNNEIQFILYQLPEEEGKVQVVIKDETIWATQKAMAQLFDVGVPDISKHLKKKYETGELERESTISKMETVVNRGFRYRLNHKLLPGHPDLVLRKYRTCIFVNGCFWHGHNVALPQTSDGRCQMEGGGTICPLPLGSSACCKIPTTNHDFWVAKIRRNKERDKEEQKQLAAMGWHCITVWECELKPSQREQTLDSIAFTLNHIYLQDHSVPKLYEPMEEETGMLMVAEQ